MKPFNLEQALAGAPVTLCGKGKESRQVRILATDLTGNFPVAFSYPGFRTGSDLVATSTKDGLSLFTPDHNAGSKLVMAPCGTLAGREVWPGDKLLSANKAAYMIVQPKHRQADIDGHVWPTTYPTVQWSADELMVAYKGDDGNDPVGVVKLTENIGNAAIRHGIDHGYLYDANRIYPLMLKLYAARGVPPVCAFEDLIAVVVSELEAGKRNVGRLRAITTLVNAELIYHKDAAIIGGTALARLISAMNCINAELSK